MPLLELVKAVKVRSGAAGQGEAVGERRVPVGFGVARYGGRGRFGEMRLGLAVMECNGAAMRGRLWRSR